MLRRMSDSVVVRWYLRGVETHLKIEPRFGKVDG